MVKPGYKQTEVGLIPEDWDVVQLKDVTTGKFTYGVNAPAVEYMPPLPNYIRITDISDDGYFVRENRASVMCASPETFTLKENDIVFARTGASTGKTYLYRREDGELVYAGFLIKASVDPLRANSRYVFASLHTNDYWDWVATTSMRSGQPGINGNEYASYQIPFPELPEQVRIAEALENIDDLIAMLEKRIAKKKAIKQGAMQELLTGKKRLPGFSGEWQHSCLGESVELPTATIMTKLIDARYYVGTDNMVADRGGVKKNCISLSYPNVREYRLDDILLSNIRPYLKKIWYATRNGGCSNDVLVIRSRDSETLDSAFLYFILSADAFFDEIMANAIGTKMPRGDKAVINNYRICFPKDVLEQRAIAEILSNMDAEIEALQQKLEKYRQIKQGMMQQLLTGKIRLV